MNSTSLGKVIISGEHSAVYGYPALSVPARLSTTVRIEEKWSDKEETQSISSKVLELMAVIRRFFPEFDSDVFLEISSSIPQNAGLGSSAALSHALAKAIAQFCRHQLRKEQLFTIVQECEKIFHGQPSGIDAATVVYETCLHFQKTPDRVVIQPLDSLETIPPFLLIDSGVAAETTKEMVEVVKNHPNKHTVLKQIGLVTQKIGDYLKDGAFSLELIAENEKLLEELGVVSEKAISIIRSIEQLGGAAKITGAGGITNGSGVIIAFHDDMQKLKEWCTINRFHLFN